jgi:SAM-dependent methyltransferase
MALPTDIFGEALLDYSKGDRHQFYFMVGKHKHMHDITRYFRTTNQLDQMEKTMIRLTKGNILDVGCGTAHYFPALAKRGHVFGIDTSPGALAIAKKNGYNCAMKDIFSYNTRKKYDTITLFENNIGMAGKPENLKRLLAKLSGLLAPGGQILLHMRNSKDGDYFIAKLEPVWRGRKGKMFPWLMVSTDYLRKQALAAGLQMQIKAATERNSLVRLVPNSP